MQDIAPTIKNDLSQLPVDKQLQKVFHAQVVEEKNVALGVKVITFKINEPFSFSPWQYVWVEIPELKISDLKGNRRAFSILNTINDQNTIQILVRISESGYKQSLFALVPGDNVTIHGPFGHSFIVDESHQPKYIAMIAGGVGIAAFIPMLKTIKEKQWPINCYLVYLNSSPEVTPLIPQLEELKKGWNTFDYKVKYAHFSWEDVGIFNGKITGSNEWWIAGSKPMVDFVFTELEKGGISRFNMVFENYYPTVKDNFTIEQVNQQLTENNIFAKGIQNSTNHTVITDAEGIILYANHAAEKITGYLQDEMVGNTPRLWGGLMSREFYVELWKNKLLGKPFEGELMNRRKNGEIYYAMGHISPIFGSEKKVIGFIATEEDITELKKIQNNLERANAATKNVLEDLQVEKQRFAEAQAKDEAMLSSIGDGTISVDYEAKVIFINEVACKLLRLNQKEVVGKKLSDVIPIEDQEGNNISEKDRPLVNVLAGSSPVVGGIYTYIRSDKTKFPVRMTCTPTVLNGHIIGAIEIFQDITKEKEIDQEKSEFISLASHQLRTPLTAINWSCEMLLSGDSGAVTPKQKEYIDEVYAGSQRMVKLVSALLNVSRIETGTFLVDPEPVDIIKIVHSVLDESKKKVEDKKLIVSIESDEIPSMLLDPNLTTIIFQNLLTNSIKYTPSGGQIKISLKKCMKGAVLSGAPLAEDSLLIQVIDNGIGIPQAHQKDVFTKLFRADNARAADQDGTGLGLYLVKSLIEHAGGKIWFTSVEGKGTSFFVLIPLSGMVKREGTRALSQRITLD